MRRIVIGALVLLSVAAVVVSCRWALGRVQRSVLFPAPGGRELAHLPGGMQRVWLEDGGAQIEAWWQPPRDAGESRPAIVFFHGNAELIDDWGELFARASAEWDVGVLLVEYPGYGRSGGRPSEASIRRAAVRAYDWAREQPGVAVDRIVAWGRSLGGGAACALAEQRAVAALVLESTFTSVPDMARALGLPGRLVLDRFDNLAGVRAFGGPVLVLHGERDELIPSAQARALAAAAPRSTLQLFACGHNDCPRPWAEVDAFLRAHRLL